MKIKEILSQHRRDFIAIYVCEHCGYEEESDGYDDENFHRNVIPNMMCKKCGEKANENYRPLATKYPEGFQIQKINKSNVEMIAEDTGLSEREAFEALRDYQHFIYD